MNLLYMWEKFSFFILVPLKGRGESIVIRSVCLSVRVHNPKTIHRILIIFSHKGESTNGVVLIADLYPDPDRVSSNFFPYF